MAGRDLFICLKKKHNVRVVYSPTNYCTIVIILTVKLNNIGKQK